MNACVHTIKLTSTPSVACKPYTINGAVCLVQVQWMHNSK